MTKTKTVQTGEEDTHKKLKGSPHTPGNGEGCQQVQNFVHLSRLRLKGYIIFYIQYSQGHK